MKCKDCNVIECPNRGSDAVFSKPCTIINQDSFDWKPFRNQAAKDILCAFATRLETNETPDMFDPDFYSRIAVEWADSLIEALKEKEEK